MLQAGFIIGKLLEELSDREGFLFHVHYVADLTTYGKGIITKQEVIILLGRTAGRMSEFIHCLDSGNSRLPFKILPVETRINSGR